MKSNEDWFHSTHMDLLSHSYRFFSGEYKNGSCTTTPVEIESALVLKDSLEAYIEIKYLLKLQFFRVQKVFWNFW